MKKYIVQTITSLAFYVFYGHVIAHPTETEENKQDNRTIVAETVQAIRAKVQSQWVRPHEVSSSPLSCNVVVELFANGTLKGVRLSKTSGNTDFDESVLTAVRNASPFPIPEKEFERFKLFSFVFKAAGHFDETSSTQTTSVGPIPSYVVVRKDIQKNLFLDDDKLVLSSSELLTRIVDKLQKNPHLELIVKGDMDLPYGEIIQLLQLLQQAGVEKIHIDQLDLLND